MKIFSANQVRDIDRYTIENEPIPSIDLMERAAKQIAGWIIAHFINEAKFKIFVGPGNNGGDALAIARLLSDKKFNIEVFVVKISDKLSKDAEINLKRLTNIDNIKINILKPEDKLPSISKNEIIIDGLFGSGLTRPLEGFPAKIVNLINSSHALVIAVDVPSGLFGEDNSENNINNIVKTDYTLTFQFLNLSFLFPENYEFVGEWVVLPIGLHNDIINKTETNYYLINEDWVKNSLIKRKKFAHKGNFGHALLVSGSYGKMGAAILASRACLRTGVGLLTVHIPQTGYEILQTAVPEAMVCIDESEINYCQQNEMKNFDVIGIGPGIGKKKSMKMAVKAIIENSDSPLVIDADGINILAENKEWMKNVPKNSILTPHPKEFERLFGKSTNSFSRINLLIDSAKKYNIFIVLKGAHTAIACPDGSCYFNTTGNPGMATAGSGDVLTGIILSLLAQNYSPKEAVILGVYLHGLSGDIAACELSEESIIAGDIINYLSHAFKSLKES
ncbi:MAG: NAD(P)H-hydrate dehydratase [Bacteroidales bacterium]|nr:NAD(P)H-hydrate dehydratase [Bacteroidales bacterium]